jgi:AraC-like DNA-binding protein
VKDNFRKYFDVSRLPDSSREEANWGINVLSTGHNIHAAHKAYPDADHPGKYRFDWSQGRVLEEYQLVYIANGGGVFEAENFSRVDVYPGTVFLLYPNIWHRYRPSEEKGWEEYWVGFNGAYADYLMKQECFSTDISLIHMGFDTEFMNVFSRLLDTLRFEGVAYSQISSCLTIHLLGLVYASALMKEKSSNRKEQIINNIKYKIHESINQSLNMDVLAAQHNVSYTWFRNAFKEIVGVSPGQYQLNLKIEKACTMLKETDFSISEVAFNNGFESEYHFSRIFKKKTNMSPSAYRNVNHNTRRGNML